MADSRSLAVIAGSYLIGAGFYSQLPGPYLPGDQGVPFARPAIAFLLPTAAAVTYSILQHLQHDRFRGAEALPERIDSAIIFRIMLFLVALHTLIVSDLIGIGWVRAWAGRGVLVLFGLLMIGIGNLLPCTRPNLAFGLRTRRTLKDRHLWMHTHRMSGYVAVCLGLVIVISGAFLSGSTLSHVIGTAAMVAVTALGVSFWSYSRA